MTTSLDEIRAALADRFTVRDVVGEGASAVVLEARDVRHDRLVAIKVLRSELGSSLAKDRFLQEIQIASGLQHPHILPIFDSGVAAGCLYCVMPYVQEDTLRAHLAKKGSLPVAEAVRLASEAGDALAHAHARGLVHRDVKPGNILLSAGHAVIADFGIATAIEQAATRLTGTGLSLGTPHYMSPEQAAAERSIDGRADQYALGCVVYEMLVGEPPFAGRTAREVLTRHLTEPAPRLRDFVPDVPEAVEEAVLRALAKDPDDRWPGMPAFVEALGGEHLSPSIAAGPTRKGATTLRRVLLRVGIPLLAAGGALALWSAFRGEGDFPPSAPAAAPAFVAELALPDFWTSSADPEDRRLASDLTLASVHALESLDAVSVFGPRELQGPLSRQGVQAGEQRPGLEASAAAAAELGARRVGLGQVGRVDAEGDSLRVLLSLHEIGGGPAIRREEVVGTATDLEDLACRVALALLEVDPAEHRDHCLYRQVSRSFTARQEYLAGLAGLYRWRLDEARERFGAAIRADSGFALPYHYLAVTLAHVDELDPRRSPRFADSVRALTARAASLAERSAGDLPPGDALRIRAFHLWKRDRVEAARETYGQLLERHPTDYAAWYGMAALELDDRVYVTGPDGQPRPRHDPNRALRGFREALRLQPSAFVAFGGLAELYRETIEAGLLGFCPGYGPVPDAAAPRGDDPFERMLFFCPLWVDSIALVPRDSLPVPNRAEVERAARSHRDSLVELLRTWMAEAPEHERPHVELAATYLAVADERGRADDDAARRAALDTVRTHLEAALAKAETPIPEAEIDLANLYLADGRVADAARLAERALGEMDSLELSFVPPSVANVFVAAGRPDRALELVRGRDPGYAYRVRVEPDRWIGLAGAEPVLAELAVLGGVGSSAGRIESLVDSLWSLWASPEHGRQEVAAILRATFPVGWHLEPALITAPRARAAWARRYGDIPAWWEALEAAEAGDTAAARLAIEDAAAALREATDRGTPYRHYLLGLAALWIGEHREAVRQFSRLDDPGAFDPRQLDPLSGLRTLSHLYRARALAAAGDTAGARAQYRTFADWWQHAEPPLDSLLAEARAATGS